jgi:hypothetical protein
MLKGTAAKNMQYAYNCHGTPSTEVLIECHTDHIDILEAMLISRINPELNSDRPADPFDGENVSWLVEHSDIFSHSTLAHAKAIRTLTDSNTELKELIKDKDAQISEIENINEDLMVHRRKEEIEADIEKRILGTTELLKRFENQNYVLSYDNRFLKNELDCRNRELEYLRKPWWKRIFS